MKTHRPILMTPELAHAAYDGRKTQTRRIGERYAKWQVGDLLWVRETWAVRRTLDFTKPSDLCPHGAAVHYASFGQPEDLKYRPSIHMPRWASRTTLRIKNICLEPLHDITDADALAEGIKNRFGVFFGGTHRLSCSTKTFCTARRAFAALWDDINGYGAWNSNPDVWRIEFAKVPAP